MANGVIVVTAATGNIGKKLVENLLAKGEKVRAVGRSAKKLEPLNRKGAERLVPDHPAPDRQGVVKSARR